MSWDPADATNEQRTSKLSFIPNLRAKPLKGEILWEFDFFNNVAGSVLAAMLEGTTLPSNMMAKTKTCSILHLLKV